MISKKEYVLDTEDIKKAVAYYIENEYGSGFESIDVASVKLPKSQDKITVTVEDDA